jgi:hypothetical protein
MNPQLAGLFVRGLIQCSPVGANTYLLAHGYWGFAFPLSFWINWVWRHNARSASSEWGGLTDYAYALGGSCGAVGGAALVSWWLR